MKQLNTLFSALSARPLMLLFLFVLLPTMASAQCPDNNHPHMIDLGLPSGTKWACCNVGAEKPEDYGGYYAWGETEEKDVYDWSTYIHCDGSEGTCHNIGSNISRTEYDVAHVKWGGSWVMPNFEQMEELGKRCTSEWTTENGVNGIRFTGSNGASIFLPAAGKHSKDKFFDAGSEGNYWSSTLFDGLKYEARIFVISSEGVYLNYIYDRKGGLSVRPVVAPSGIVIDETTFPDDIFRDWVLNQSYGRDGVLTEAEIATVRLMMVSGKNIADLKGIEYFTSLNVLPCKFNQLTSLDLSQNTALTDLWCGDNQLTSLDVSQCTALSQFGCENNQLTSLDVSQCTVLIQLGCENNQLTSLDLSKNTALKYLNCQNNQLTSLDVSQNTALESIVCYSNRINETEMGRLVESLPEKNGDFYVKNLADDNEQNVITTAQVAAAKAKGWNVIAFDKDGNTIDYDGDEPTELEPINNGESIDIGTDIDENTNLDGNVVDNVYFNINDGSYDASGGCIVVNSATDDSFIDGKDIFGDDFKEGYNGIVFMVPAGEGSIFVEAETTGNMVLKVKIGNSKPITMELSGKLKVPFPYDVSEDTYVYIYGGTSGAGARGMSRAAGSGSLKIYGIEVTNGSSGIEYNNLEPITNNRYYNLNGQRIEGQPSQKGVYIKNGKKVLMK